MMLHDIPREISHLNTIPIYVFVRGDIECPECGSYIDFSYEHHDCIGRNILKIDMDNVIYCECGNVRCGWHMLEGQLERVYHYVELDNQRDWLCKLCQDGRHPAMERSNDTRLLW